MAGRLALPHGRGSVGSEEIPVTETKEPKPNRDREGALAGLLNRPY